MGFHVSVRWDQVLVQVAPSKLFTCYLSYDLSISVFKNISFMILDGKTVWASGTCRSIKNFKLGRRRWERRTRGGWIWWPRSRKPFRMAGLTGWKGTSVDETDILLPCFTLVRLDVGLFKQLRLLPSECLSSVFGSVSRGWIRSQFSTLRTSCASERTNVTWRFTTAYWRILAAQWMRDFNASLLILGIPKYTMDRFCPQLRHRCWKILFYLFCRDRAHHDNFLAF